MAVELMPGITAVEYALPAHSISVRELAENGQLRSEPELLEQFGFAHVRTATTETPYDLALTAARRLLRNTRLAARSIDMIISVGPQGPTAFTTSPDDAACASAHRTMSRFRFPGARLQYELGLERATLLGIDQCACTGLLAAVRTARAYCIAEGLERVLCVAADFFPADAGREAIFNCTSDAACAVLVERSAPRNRIRGAAHVTKGYYWDADARRDEMLAAYFPTARHVIEQAAVDAGWRVRDIDWIVPHNVSSRSWELLLRLLDLPHDRLWAGNIARIGHTLAGDNFINLADATAAGAIQAGQRLMLFSYGYGAHWTALALQA